MHGTREKCEQYEGYLFLCFRSLSRSRDSETFFDGVNVYIILAREFVIVAHEKPVFDLQTVSKRLDKLQRTTGISLTAGWILYAIIDNMIQSFIPYVQAIEMEVDSVDELVLVLSESERADMVRRIWSARKRITALYRLMFAKSDVIRALSKRSLSLMSADVLLYFRDILDNVIVMNQTIVHGEEILNRSHSNYLVQISIEISLYSNNLSKIMKKLTAAAAIVLPLSLIAGLWGMNTGVPGQGDVVWFYGIVAVMVVLAICLFLAGRHYDWF